MGFGGEGGIRTHEPGFARPPAFEAGSFNRSDTSPRRGSTPSLAEAAEPLNRTAKLSMISVDFESDVKKFFVALDLQHAR